MVYGEQNFKYAPYESRACYLLGDESDEERWKRRYTSLVRMVYGQQKIKYAPYER
jgi:hypothetical protein